MARQVTSENARINRRCETALTALQATSSCSRDASYRAHAACSHVRYGTRLDKHATKVLKKHAAECPSTAFSGIKRRRRKRR